MRTFTVDKKTNKLLVTDTETTELSVDEIKANIAGCDDGIAELEEKITQLKERRAQFQSCMDQLKK